MRKMQLLKKSQKKKNKELAKKSSHHVANNKKTSGYTRGTIPGGNPIMLPNKTNHRYHKTQSPLNTDPSVFINSNTRTPHGVRGTAPTNAGPVAPRRGRDGFTNMNTVINRIVNDSSMLVSQQNYEYILWIVLAILAIAIFIRVRRK